MKRQKKYTHDGSGWFDTIRNDVKKELRKNPTHRIIGEIRREKVTDVLLKLKREGKINNFLHTGLTSPEKIIKGIDFFVVYVDKSKYTPIEIAVTTPGRVEDYSEEHPNTKVISIKNGEVESSIRKKLLQQIENAKAVA